MDNRFARRSAGAGDFGEGNEVAIGDRIRRIRKKRRLTQAELAMMSGLSLSAIQGYEQGRYEPKRKSLESIAEVFKIPVDELYDIPAELGTNLAEVGTDCISRQQAIDAFNTNIDELVVAGKENADAVERYLNRVIDEIKQLPPIQPEIVRCKDCKHYKEWESEFTPNAVVTQCMADNFPIRKAIPDGWFCAGAERRTNEE